MPQQRWKHTCANGEGLRGMGSPVCRTCGGSGEYDGWHLGMYEKMARYQGRNGLKPVGPHRKMADELLGPVTRPCGACAGRGLRDTADGSSWRECEACRGFGSVFTRPAEEIAALRRRVLATHPDAAADSPLPDSAWRQDVLALLPPSADTAHLERVWRLSADAPPLEKLASWLPAEEGVGLTDLAFKDDVTGLYNRRFFSIRLDEEVSRHRRSSHPVSVVLLQLDGLGRINDELGRAADDETLRAVAEILLKWTRGVNVVSRHGGGLFAVVMVETSLVGARLYVDRIRYVLSSATLGHGHPVTARFGIASLPEDGAGTGADLVRHADQRLRTASPGRR